MVRYQTSLGRDLGHGQRLDRNEKVTNFPSKVFQDILRSFPPHIISASPEADALYEKIAKALQVDRSKVYITCGITEGVRFVLETLTHPGDNIVVLDPTYPMYRVYAEFFQLEYRKMRVNSDLKADIQSLYDNIDEKTAVVAIPNPNLPVETALSRHELLPVLKFCQTRDIVVIIDEAYHYFGAESLLDMVDHYDNLIVMRTFSKAFGGAGLRLGFMVSQAENINYFSKTRSIVESNTFSMRVGEYLLDHPQIMHDHVKEVKAGAQYLKNELKKAGIRFHGGDLTNGILIFLDSPAAVKETVEYLREKKIYIRGSFEPPFESCIRVSLGPVSSMRIFMAAFSARVLQRTL